MRQRARTIHPSLEGQGFEHLYQERSASLVRFFARQVYQADVALDLTAETFAEALVSRAKFTGQSESELLAWLYGIARHQLTRYYRHGQAERRALRKLGVEVPALSDNEVARIEELAGLERLRSVTATALDGLSEDQRDAVRLRVVEELDYGEVARRLGVSETTARSRVSRGLRALAKTIGSGYLREEPT